MQETPNTKEGCGSLHPDMYMMTRELQETADRTDYQKQIEHTAFKQRLGVHVKQHEERCGKTALLLQLPRLQ